MFQSRAESPRNPTELATEVAWAGLPAAPSALRDSAPDRVGRFTLAERLGGGGTSTVWASVDPPTGQPVAIKLMRADRVGHRGAQMAFERESALLATLDHPGIPRLVAQGITDDGRSWIAMERVPGRTLGHVLSAARHFTGPARRRFVHDVLLPAFDQVCRTVSHAHARGWIHRDLKPPNLVLDADGHAHVIDWGLARPIDDLVPTRRRGITGTPGYISPDQLQDTARRVDASADVFALGAVLYEILTGDRAFGWARNPEQLRRLMALEPAPPMVLEPDLDRVEQLSKVTMQAIAQRPERRPTTVEALRASAALPPTADRLREAGGEPTRRAS